MTQTVRYICKISDLIAEYPTLFDCQILDLTDTPTVHQVVKEAFEKHGSIDVIINNAGYGLFGAAEELSDEQVDLIIATNLTGSIQMIRSALPFLRKQGHGRIIQISSCGGQVLGSQALASTIATLENRLADFRTQTELASSTDYKE